MGRSMKGQMKTADKLAAVFAVIIGDEELAAQCAQVRNMETKEQEAVPFAALVSYIESHKKG